MLRNCPDHDRLLFTNGGVNAGRGDKMVFGIRDGRPRVNQAFLAGSVLVLWLLRGESKIYLMVLKSFNH